ncbi:alpha/beta fold hydrolase [Kibdelosporangium persicum]|uniref:Pimeloyl-ACP methyl ester carboxylesterase n=1 Tax=Kibdelosporangium persicum TaxID=2698649 RepID=A0ABX2FJ26_9PSEU|nr:alpha/beta hydrolase [Kibdelosporangium persicum]NRN71302.1 Pimeloyl-ACP methyl ester carboxylesterase [Kibdelosporangium persicum]
MAATQFLDRPGGRLAYDVQGQGPLVVCAPGLADLRFTYRDLAALLVAEGYTVVTMDLRGLGESSVDWPSYTESDVAADMVAVIQALDAGPAVLVGCDYSAGAAVVAAANHPDLIAGLVLSGQRMREHPANAVAAVGRWLIRRPGFGRYLWNRAWPWLWGPHKPSDFPERQRAVAANLAEPGRYEAVRAMLRPGTQNCELAMPHVTCPVLIVSGDADPAYSNQSPEAEARFVADRLGGPAEVRMVRGAGYYPHAEQPEYVFSVCRRWLTTHHQLKLLGND